MLLGTDFICIVISLNLIGILWSSHELLQFAFIVPWVFVVYLAFYVGGIDGLSTKFKMVYQVVGLLMCVCTIWNWQIKGNVAYTQLYGNYTAGISAATRIATRIENIDGYAQGKTKVLFVGSARNISKREYGSFPQLQYNQAGMGEWYNAVFTRQGALEAYLEQLINLNIKIIDISQTDIDENRLEQIESELDGFPGKNCYAWYSDDILVFKLGIEEKE